MCLTFGIIAQKKKKKKNKKEGKEQPVVINLEGVQLRYQIDHLKQKKDYQKDGII